MTVRYAVDDGIATVVLDQPANRNALSRDLVAGLRAALARAADDPDVRAVLLGHTGTTFCAGADLREAREHGMAEGTTRMLELFAAVVELPVPVIARVDGHVRAGGVGLVGACDLAFAGPGATFAFTEVRLGLAPAIISLTTLPRMPQRAAGRYLLTGETFDATQAARVGLVTEAADDLDAAIGPVLAALRLCSPQGLAETKPLTTAAVRAGFASSGPALVEQSARLFASDEAREGMTAFAEKRPPRWAR